MISTNSRFSSDIIRCICASITSNDARVHLFRHSATMCTITISCNSGQKSTDYGKATIRPITRGHRFNYEYRLKVFANSIHYLDLLFQS